MFASNPFQSLMTGSFALEMLQQLRYKLRSQDLSHNPETPS